MSIQERQFQKQVQKKLNQKESVLVIAPTGLGKTRAAVAPFHRARGHNGLLGTRLIYALPLRALTRGVEDECRQLGIQPTVHHGDEPESQFFSERAIITTIDQYLTAFAGAPLSWASHLSHAAAGAVLTSYSVLDEVHLLSPYKGLRLLFAMLYLRQRWGLLSCVMTATLPQAAVKFLNDYCGLTKVEASDKDVQERDSWRKVYLKLVGTGTKNGFQWDEKDDNELAEFVKKEWEYRNTQGDDGPKKVIVFVNTIERALSVYRKLKNLFKNSGPNLLLAHSRFTKEDREKVQENLHSSFGENAGPNPAILVTTQVAEAGLNISAPLVITDLCPMDSLIQRVGRCQRFKKRDGELVGEVFVVKPKREKWYVPYTESVRLVPIRLDNQGKENRGKPSGQLRAIELTRVVLEEKVNTQELCMNWYTEQELINKSLDRLYEAYLSGTTDVAFAKDEQSFEELYKQYQGKR